MLIGILGAAHAAELALLFGTYEIAWPLKYLSGAKQNPHGAHQVSEQLISTFGVIPSHALTHEVMHYSMYTGIREGRRP